MSLDGICFGACFSGKVHAIWDAPGPSFSSAAHLLLLSRTDIIFTNVGSNVDIPSIVTEGPNGY